LAMLYLDESAHRQVVSMGLVGDRVDFTEQCNVTVVIPVYNGQDYLAEALESVLGQTGVPNMEVLALDDGSLDSSPQILARYRDPRLTVIRHANMGLAATLNKGLALARGRFIARQDQDDLMLPGRLSKQLAFLENHSKVAMVGTWAEIRVGNQPDGRFHYHPTACDALRLKLLFDNPFVHSSVMFRTEVARTLGGYSEDRSRQPPEDYEFWSRIARRHQVANLSEVLTVYREMPGSMSRTGVNPFLIKVLQISSENLYALLAKQWPKQDCLSLAYLYHNVPNASPRPLRKREALAMIRSIVELVGGDRDQWSAEMTVEAGRLERHIASRFFQRRIPAPLIGPMRWLRDRMLGRGRV
jgi:hypothetical protein